MIKGSLVQSQQRTGLSTALTRDQRVRSRWKLLREHVLQGKFRSYWSGLAAINTRQSRRLQLPQDCFFDDSDTATDKFTKAVALLIKKRDRGKSFLMEAELKESLSSEYKENLQRDEEAYRTTMACCRYPLLDHTDLLASLTELNSESVAPATSSIARYTHILLSHIASLADSNAVPSNANDARPADTNIKVSPAIFKQLKLNMKLKLQEPASLKRDAVFHASLMRFYDDGIKKRTLAFTSVSITYRDCLQIFTSAVQSELKCILDQAQGDPARIQSLLAPYTSGEVALLARQQAFLDIMKVAVECVSNEELLQHQNQLKQQSKRHKRVTSAMTAPSHRRSASFESQQGREMNNHIRSTTAGPAAPIHEEPSYSAGGLMSSIIPAFAGFSVSRGLDQMKSDVDDPLDHLSPDCLYMLEWIKGVFMVGRDHHEQVLTDLSCLPGAKIIVKDFSERLEILESDMKADEHHTGVVRMYGLSPADFSRLPESAYFYWRKLEKQELARYISRTQKLSTQEKQSESRDEIAKRRPAKDPSAKGIIQLRILVVEARGLLVKDDDGGSDPYVVVEYTGTTQRYQTEVVSRCLEPYWNQEVFLNVKLESRSKNVKLTVWDKDDEPNLLALSPFRAKFWKDESDDFLGQVVFKGQDLIHQILQSPGYRMDRWFPLEKRTKRSHVGGELHVVMDFDDDEVKVLLQQGAFALPETVSDVLSDGAVTAEEDLKISRELHHFGNQLQLYKHVLNRFMVHDGRHAQGVLGDGSLSLVSEGILNELGERFRIGKISRELMYFKTLCDCYKNPENKAANTLGIVPSINTVIAAYKRIDQLISLTKSYMDRTKVLCPQSIDESADGSKIVNAAIISGVGEYYLCDHDLSDYSLTLADMEQHLITQIQHYKDCFPCDTPTGGLVGSLSILSMLMENDMIHPSNGALMASPDSGIDIHSPTVTAVYTEKRKLSKSVTVHDLLSELLRQSTVERYVRISEMANPPKNDLLQRLVTLADLIVEEIDSDITYFNTPFSADINVAGLTTSIYFKNFLLEIENFLGDLSSSRKSRDPSLHLAKIEAMGSGLFQLYHHIRDMQEKYVPMANDPVDEKSDEAIRQEFSIHSWFGPLIHDWLEASQLKMFSWVDKAVVLDKFTPIDKEAGILHSTSVIDIFFCFKQLLECLFKLDWVKAGGAPQSDGSLLLRQKSWNAILTRFSRVLMRSILRYCDLISKGIQEEQEKARQIESHGQHQGIGVFLQTSAQKYKSELSAEQAIQSVHRSACVRLNNLDHLRTQLSDLYESLDVRSFSEFSEKHSKKTEDNHTTQPGVSGCISFKIVHAENLLACDPTGTSDPYVIFRVIQLPLSKQIQESGPATCNQISGKIDVRPDGTVIRQLARTKIKYCTTNPRWDESFTSIIVQAIGFEIIVNDYDLVKKDDLCGEASLPLADLGKVLFDMQNHDLWIDLKPQGKILIRIQLDSTTVSSGETSLSDIEFYFRKAFREMKRQSNDILTLLANSMSYIILQDLVIMLKEAERSGRQGQGDTSFKIRNIFGTQNEPDRHSPNHNDLVDHTNLITDEEVDHMATPLTDYLNITLSCLTDHLSARSAKELLRKTWKQILQSIESVLTTSLYGEFPIIPALGRSKPLTERQVETTGKVLKVLKAFFYADGSDMGIPQSQLETAKYHEICRTIEFYWSPKHELMKKYDDFWHALQQRDAVETKDPSAGDYLLKLIRIRGNNDKETKTWYEWAIHERSKQLRWDNMVGVDAEKRDQ